LIIKILILTLSLIFVLPAAICGFMHLVKLQELQTAIDFTSYHLERYIEQVQRFHSSYKCLSECERRDL